MNNQEPVSATSGTPTSTPLHAIINSTDLNSLENLLINNNQLVDQTATLLNNIGTDPESMAKLDSEQQSLETARTSIINVKNDLMNQRTNMQRREITINGQQINLETWVANHPFSTWNYSNKISRIEVHYTSFGVMGMRIIYKDPTKAQETLGIVSNTGDSSPIIQNVDFADDEWLMQIQISNSSSNSNVPTFTLCDSISFYTSKNAPGTPPKITIPASVQNNVIQNKTYYVAPARLTWLQHKSAAEAQGAELACFINSSEMVQMLGELGNARFQNGGSFYIGLYHPNALIPNNNSGGGPPYNVQANKTSNWKWVDGTPYNPNTTNWNGGEPNNWGPGENVAQMYSNGKINDLTKTNQLAAIYQKRIVNTTSQTLRKDREHIKSFTIKPLSVTYDSVASLDISQRENALAAASSARQVITDIENSVNILDNSIININDAIAKITINIEHIKSKRALFIELNLNADVVIDNYNEQQASNNQLTEAAQEPFTNINIGGSFLSNYNNINTQNMQEGFVEGNENVGLTGAALTMQGESARITANLVNDIQAVRDRQTANSISEFVIKKDNLFTNVLTDYMSNDAKQNNFEDVYNKIDQQNTDKMRKIELNTYYDKAYKEYINIIKIIIFACVILVPIVIANKNSLLPNSITNILVVVIIFLTVIYITMKFVDIYMRDNKDFDKIRIPYDREAAILEKSGVITRKNNLLSSFSLTCIGADCCPETSGVLIYDPVKNRCVANETFAPYVSNPSDIYLDNNFGSNFGGSNFGGSNFGGSNLDNNFGSNFGSNFGGFSIVEGLTSGTSGINMQAIVGESLQNSSDLSMNNTNSQN